MINNIDVLWSSIKGIWSMYRQYHHDTVEIVSYYMVNDRIIWSYIGYIRPTL